MTRSRRRKEGKKKRKKKTGGRRKEKGEKLCVNSRLVSLLRLLNLF